jgi:hypothetical protein
LGSAAIAFSTTRQLPEPAGTHRVKPEGRLLPSRNSSATHAEDLALLQDGKAPVTGETELRQKIPRGLRRCQLVPQQQGQRLACRN